MTGGNHWSLTAGAAVVFTAAAGVVAPFSLRAEPAAVPARSHLHKRHRADSAAELPELPSPGRRRADVADHLRRGAAVGARHQAADRHRPHAGVMPPWYIEKDIGIQQYKDDPSLSDVEIAKIAKWADSGAPQGNPADLPPAKTVREREQLEHRHPGSDRQDQRHPRQSGCSRLVGRDRERSDRPHRKTATSWRCSSRK